MWKTSDVRDFINRARIAARFVFRNRDSVDTGGKTNATMRKVADVNGNIKYEVTLELTPEIIRGVATSTPGTEIIFHVYPDISDNEGESVH